MQWSLTYWIRTTYFQEVVSLWAYACCHVDYTVRLMKWVTIVYTLYFIDKLALCIYNAANVELQLSMEQWYSRFVLLLNRPHDYHKRILLKHNYFWRINFFLFYLIYFCRGLHHRILPQIGIALILVCCTLSIILVIVDNSNSNKTDGDAVAQ